MPKELRRISKKMRRRDEKKRIAEATADRRPSTAGVPTNSGIPLEQYYESRNK